MIKHKIPKAMDVTTATAARKARRSASLQVDSHESMLRELRAMERLLEKVRAWKAITLTDEKVRFETEALIELAISKQKLSLYVEDLDSILLKEEATGEGEEG